MLYQIKDETKGIIGDISETFPSALANIGWAPSDLDNTFIEDYTTHTISLGKEARVAPVAKMRDTYEVARVYTGPQRTMHLLTIYRAQHLHAINSALLQLHNAKQKDTAQPTTSRKTKAKRQPLPIATIAKPWRDSRSTPKPQTKRMAAVGPRESKERPSSKRVPKRKVQVQHGSKSKPTTKRTKSRR